MIKEALGIIMWTTLDVAAFFLRTTISVGTHVLHSFLVWTGIINPPIEDFLEPADTYPINQYSVNGNTALISATLRNDKDYVERLLRYRGIEVDRSDDDGYSPLHHAVSAQRLDIIPLLLDKGASITLKNNFEESPLSLACRHHTTDCLDSLLGGKSADEIGVIINQEISVTNFLKLSPPIRIRLEELTKNTDLYSSISSTGPSSPARRYR